MATDRDVFMNALRELGQSSPMKCEIVDSTEAMYAAVERHKAEGRRLAAVSNAGLQSPQRRLTFLPASAFTGNSRPDTARN